MVLSLVIDDASLRFLPHHFKMSSIYLRVGRPGRRSPSSIVSEMTYTVLSGTLNSSIPYHHLRPFPTIMSLTVNHLTSCNAQTLGASSFGMYPPLFLFVVLLISSSISPLHCQNTSATQMQVVFIHPLYLQSMFLLRRGALEKLLSEVEA